MTFVKSFITLLLVLSAASSAVSSEHDEFSTIEEFSAFMEQQYPEEVRPQVGMRGLRIFNENNDPKDCSATDRTVQDGNSRLTVSKCGILERKQCIAASAISSSKFSDPLSNPKCKANTCGGCCRDYGYLECDETGQQHSWVACICNSRTFFEEEASGSSSTKVGGVRMDTWATNAINVGPTAPFAVVARAPVPVPAPITSRWDASTCDPLYADQGLGFKPPSSVVLPLSVPRGECVSSWHCRETPGRCCLKDYCFCGTPLDDRSNCRD